MSLAILMGACGTGATAVPAIQVSRLDIKAWRADETVEWSLVADISFSMEGAAIIGVDKERTSLLCLWGSQDRGAPVDIRERVPTSGGSYKPQLRCEGQVRKPAGFPSLEGPVTLVVARDHAESSSGVLKLGAGRSARFGGRSLRVKDVRAVTADREHDMVEVEFISERPFYEVRAWELRDLQGGSIPHEIVGSGWTDESGTKYFTIILRTRRVDECEFVLDEWQKPRTETFRLARVSLLELVAESAALTVQD